MPDPGRSGTTALGSTAAPDARLASSAKELVAREPLSAERRRIVLSTLFAAGMLYTVMQSLLLPAVRTLSDALHVTPANATWVLSAYVLSGGVATPIAGRLGDMYGKKQALLWVLAVMAAGATLCAVSHSLLLMVIGRLLAGVSSGVFPLGYGIIRDEFPHERVGPSIAIISVSVGIGTGVGVLLAGFILRALSYHWLFWLPLAVTIPTLLAAWRLVPESPVRPGGRIDWLGAGLMSSGLAATLLGISEASSWGWGSPKTLLLLAGGLALLVIWVLVELRTAEPLIDMRTMAITTVWRSNLAGGLFGFGMFAAFSIVPQFVEQPHSAGYGFAASVVSAGLFLLPSAIAMALFGPVAGGLDRRVGSKTPLTLGALAALAGFMLLALAPNARLHVYAAMTLVGVGLGLGFAALPNLIVRAVPHEQTGAATGINTITRVLGGALGIQICATILAQHVIHPGAPPLQSGFTLAFWVCAAGLAGATAVAALVPRRKGVTGTT